jgi:HEAT repeat protein
MRRIVLLFVYIFFVLSCGLSPRQKAMKILQDSIEDESVIIRVHAAQALEHMGDERGTTVLCEILEGEDTDGIVTALSALCDIGDETLSVAVMRLAEHNDPSIRTEAYRLIGGSEHKKAREILLKGRDDKIAKIRRTSYLGLEKFRQMADIQKGLHDIDPVVRITAASVLARLGEQGMRRLIKNELKAGRPDVWTYGIVALAETGDTGAVTLASGLLRDAPLEWRIAAAEALLVFDNDDGIDVLKQGLSSNDPFVRIQVVEVLKKYRVPALFESLKEATKDEYVNVSTGAIEALAKHHSKKSLTLFRELMDVPNTRIKIVAANAYLMNL